jgi:hypothetical protein
MGQVIKKENIVISIGKYPDKQTGQERNQWRTIGELITMQGDDGSVYQFGKLWGAGGVTEIKVFEQEDKNKAMQAAGVQQPQQAQQHQQAPQQQYNQTPQQNQFNNQPQF